jgi:hypothetical protein
MNFEITNPPKLFMASAFRNKAVSDDRVHMAMLIFPMEGNGEAYMMLGEAASSMQITLHFTLSAVGALEV